MTVASSTPAIDATGVDAPEDRSAPSMRLRLSDLWSFEASLLLLSFAGTFKQAPGVRQLGATVDITVLMAAITFVIGALVLAFRRRPGVFSGALTRRYTALWGVFALYALASFLLTEDSVDALRKTQRVLVFNTLTVLGATVIIRDSDRVARFLRLTLAYAALSCAISLTYAGAVGARAGVYGTTGYHALGAVAGTVIVLCAVQLTLRRGGHLRSPYTWLLALGLAAAAASGVRHTVTGVVASLAFIAYWHFSDRTGRVTRMVQFGAFLALVIAVGLTLRFGLVEGDEATAAEQRMLSTVEAFASGDAARGSAGRFMIWGTALDVWYDNPIFGAGFGNFRLAGVLETYRQPHNLFLEALSELGLCGLVLILALTVSPFVVLHQSIARQRSPLVVAVGAMLVFTITRALTSGDFADNRQIFQFAGLLLGCITFTSAPSAQRAAAQSPKPGAPDQGSDTSATSPASSA